MEALDLVFMIDATGSMAASLAAAHSQAASIARSIRDQYGNTLDFRFATVCYRDQVEDGIPSEAYSFTADAEALASFFGRVQAVGGGDGPEDWAAGIAQMLNLNWRPDSMKCVVWIADAPAHGLRYPAGTMADNHPNLEYQLEPFVVRLAQGRTIFHSLDLGGAAPTFSEIKKIYARNGGVSMSYEQFVVSGGNAAARIGALLQHKTMMAVQETVMTTAAPVGSPLRRSASALRMRPPTPVLGTPGPSMSGIWTTLAQEYANIQILSGNGGQSTVYEATRRRDADRVVIKHMNVPTDTELKYFSREVEALRQLSSNPYCLPYIASSIVGREGVIITPFIPNRDLSTALNREAAQDMDASWPTAKSKIAFRIAATLKYIHSRGFVHRDIKPMNVFLNSYFEPVIGDWGLARNLAGYSVGGVQEAPTFNFGTPYFMAPELYGDDDAYGYDVDVFAWGVLIYAMFAKGESLTTLFDDGQVPRSCQQAMQKVQRGIRYKHLADIPYAWWTLIQQCWSGSPGSRPTMAAIVTTLTSNPAAYMFPGTNEQELRAFAQTLQ
jgi:hypothetical protein